ncbi:META domain-containing protein [Halopseudomonas salegens]|uniref:Heat shock protein HslJ n=1 Tax=Halopseudomonas salegens TaxID=1434072 RepID=A0A1H2H906_9GAMM|nr:META domain-containing protein [Halopseudomonas salegens]SDU28283.1 Heat shock protein HslJ [Halopseudomonas salegens]
MNKVTGVLSVMLAVGLLGGCSGEQGNGQATAQPEVSLPALTRISGNLTYSARIALSPDVVAVVQVTGAEDSDDLVLAEQRIQLEGRQVPIAFALEVDAETLAQAEDWRLQARIEDGGRTRWLSEALMLDPASGDQALGDLELMPYRDTAMTSVMNCGQRQIRAGHDGENLVLDVADERIVLLPVVAASGARYEAKGDPDTRFWSKGEQALLTLKGEEYPLCVAQGALPRPLQARGNEPFWRIDLDDQLTLRTPDEEVRELPYEVERLSGDESLIRSLDLGLELRLHRSLCHDSMSGMPYPYRAELTRSGTTHSGCAGDPEQLLQGTTWVVESINSAAPLDGSRVTLRFAPEQRLSGVASCNNFMAGYQLSGEGLSLQQVATTKKACESALMDQEQTVLAFLQGVQGFNINEDGELVLYSAEEQSLTARQAD